MGKYLRSDRTCADDKLRECFEKDRSYSPLDMTSKAMTHEASAAKCQARCADTAGCEHFTWFQFGGNCHLQDKFSQKLPLSLGAVAGPPSCGDMAVLRKDQLRNIGR